MQRVIVMLVCVAIVCGKSLEKVRTPAHKYQIELS